MKSIFKFLSLFVVVTLGLQAAGPAHADGLDIEGDFIFVTDHIFRGISRSGGEPAIQMTFDLVHEKGWYFGTFVSNFQDAFGHEIETEIYAGYLFSKGAYDFNLAVSYDSFHGAGDTTGYVEFRGSIARDFGLLYLTGGVAFSPDKREFGGGSSVYVYTAADFPIPFPSLPPMSLGFHVGHETFSGGFNKWDWSVGFYVDLAGLEWSVKYTDTSRNIKGAGGNVLAGIRGYF